MNDDAKQRLTEAQERYYDDLDRMSGRKRKLADLLLDHQQHPNYELATEGGLSFQGYLYALRNEGWQIDSRPEKRGVWTYQLVGRGEPRLPRRGLSQPQRRVGEAYGDAIQREYGKNGLTRVAKHLPEWLRDDEGGGTTT